MHNEIMTLLLFVQVEIRLLVLHLPQGSAITKNLLVIHPTHTGEYSAEVSFFSVNRLILLSDLEHDNNYPFNKNNYTWKVCV